MSSHLSQRRFISAAEFAAMLGKSPRQFWRLEATNKIGPARRQLSGDRAVYFLLEEVNAWIETLGVNGALPDRPTWEERWRALIAAQQTSVGRIARPTRAG